MHFRLVPKPVLYSTAFEWMGFLQVWCKNKLLERPNLSFLIQDAQGGGYVAVSDFPSLPSSLSQVPIYMPGGLKKTGIKLSLKSLTSFTEYSHH